VSPAVRIQIEHKLELEFESPTWEAVKWDDEASYRNGIQRIDASAVDILATRYRSAIHLIEVKDPRGFWTQYRDRNPNEQLADLVAGKVRDTIAGLVYARDRHPGDHLVVHLKSLFQNREVRPFVILWLEGVHVEPALATTLTVLIERRLAWLKPKVIVTSRRLWRGLSGLTVRSLAGAPWQG
jgi:hypothetical protein